MGDIFKRLTNLAKSELNNLRNPEPVDPEFMEYLRKQAQAEQKGGSYSSYQSSSTADNFEETGGYDPYKTLEISRDAPWDEIEKAYKKMARKYHPDRFQNEKERENATKVMSVINSSFSFLKEKHKP